MAYDPHKTSNLDPQSHVPHVSPVQTCFFQFQALTPSTRAHRYRVYRHKADGARTYQKHPHFPNLPANVPLTYFLSMKACLSDVPCERPSFDDLRTLIDDTAAEVLSGTYINSEGLQMVRTVPACMCCTVL
jgi:hypothetical protein